ncbi:GAF domain-containing protein [Nocardioides anomalus]|uniref:histidine kinase n=1 Tax=Nocardioides anomalus TaxID=2712223 RepID=A0A6G6WBG5_9ACTN|nr:GAF domain-containing protein [Nocardioides anomalus]QIG42497.1 GAF domain-containing protein [Nocardioides anomalus]
MIAAGIDDQRRVAAITAYDAVRLPPRAELQSVVELAARVAEVPKATVNVITATEQHQIAAVGFEPGVCRREDSMCTVTLREARPVRLRDASLDPRFAHNPFVTGVIADVRFYASYPLVTSEGVAFGTLCVFDEEPRELTEAQEIALQTLAARVVDVFELRLRNRELALSIMEIQAVQAELERSNERLASFAGQVSHDLKTPLTTLSLSLSLIREDLDSGRVGVDHLGLLDRAIKGSERMSDLIDDVLDYARLGGTLKATEVDLAFVVGEVLEDLSAELTDVTVQIDRLPSVLGDRAQLRAVLQNLVANAAKYRDPGRAPPHPHRGPPRPARLAHRDHRQRPRRPAGRPQPRLRAPRPRRRVGRGQRHRAGHLPPDRRRPRRPDRHRPDVHRGRALLVRAPGLTVATTPREGLTQLTANSQQTGEGNRVRGGLAHALSG